VLGKHNVKQVYIEGLAYRAQHFQFSQAAATQYLTDRLQQLNFSVSVVGINTIKKGFANNGRASKAQMKQHFKNLGLKLPIPLAYQADAIDSYAIFHTVTKETNKGEHIFNDKRRKS
jgi:Holliday junction resolvasome RuvABC endonuclease subunit